MRRISQVGSSRHNTTVCGVETAKSDSEVCPGACGLGSLKTAKTQA